MNEETIKDMEGMLKLFNDSSKSLCEKRDEVQASISRMRMRILDMEDRISELETKAKL